MRAERAAMIAGGVFLEQWVGAAHAVEASVHSVASKELRLGLEVLVVAFSWGEQEGRHSWVVESFEVVRRHLVFGRGYDPGCSQVETHSSRRSFVV